MWGLFLSWTVVAMIGFMIVDLFRQQRDTVLFLRYVRRDLRESAARSAVTRSPKAAIVLSLRGPDPCLTQTLEALLKLDYPDFHIQVVVDSDLDPVLNDVVAVKEKGRVDQIRVSVLRQVRSSCSLKCGSLIQAVTDLPEDVEIVAFIDGDVVPHAAWLKELVQPLVQGEADVVGGNRWYQPPDAAWGSMTRYIWNAGFLRGMWTQGTPWAGTMAMRKTTIEQIGLLNAWGTAMSVDATLHHCLTSHHLKFKLAASLIMTNRESISLERFHNWVTRQMAVIRYTASETLLAIQIQIGVLLLLHMAVPAMSVAAFLMGRPLTGIAALVSLAIYWLIHGLAIVMFEQTMRIGMRQRGEETRWITLRKSCRWYLSVAMAHYVIGFGVLRVLGIKEVDWRGIRYRLSTSGVQMQGYTPFGAKWIRQDNRSVV